ncbi:MAG: hypothetical protein B0D92_00920 [Spirochaeta sp. LUC14_002_19_P3]|nr:MAG: hypothetical protein B0D92_00920 [Spirochaeta sp. LUC14_002_19_P3]
MTVLMVTSEAIPFAKSGGLGDAVPALARALKKRGIDVGIVMPRYYSTDKNTLFKYPNAMGVPMGDTERWCAVYRTELPSSRIPVWMLDREDLFGRQGLYGPDGSHSWADNSLRFAFLSAAAFQLSRFLGRIPDILHLHDWQSAPVAWLLKHFERARGFEHTASVLTIHNLGYQGVFPPSEAAIFPQEALNAGFADLLRGADMNFLAAGINCADAINTVSPSYAKEILLPEYSEGLGAELNAKTDRLRGILNGMDYADWNPARDKALRPLNYDWYWLRGKAKLKARLQREAGLPLREDVPLFGMVTRLTGQKGIDLLTDIHSPALKEFREGRAQLAILGSGERRYEEALEGISKEIPENCRARIGFSGPYSRLVEAGSDFFIMPSRYEPCGLNQMYSLRYGTLPIVRRTGGLADTVRSLDTSPQSGNGFVFNKPDSRELGDTLSRAVSFYKNTKTLQKVRKRAMRLRFDWNASSEQYEALYRQAMEE